MISTRGKLFFLCVASLGVYCTQLGNPLGGGHSDEPLYIGIAKEMWRRHEWILPYFHGHLAFYKPPLLYWMMIASFKLFGGFSLFAARFPSALCGSLVILVTALLGIRLFDKKTGIIAGCITATTIPGVYAFTRASLMDVPLLLTITTSFYFAVLGAKENKSLFSGLAFAIVGVSTLFKGPVAIFLGLIPILYYIVAQKKSYLLLEIHSLGGIFMMIIITLFWPIAVYLKGHGHEWVDFFILQENFGKFTHRLDPTTRSISGSVIWIHLLSQFLPWSFFLLSAFLLFIIKKEARNKESIFLLIWILTVSLVFLLPQKKLSHYILPALPACALFTSAMFVRYKQLILTTTASYLTGAIFALAGLLLLPLSRVAGTLQGNLIVVLASICFLGSALFAFKKKLLVSTYCILGFLFFYALGLPHLMSTLDLKAFRQATENQPIYSYNLDLNLVGTATERDITPLSLEEAHQHGVVVLPKSELRELTKHNVLVGAPILSWSGWKDHIRLLDILHAILSGHQDAIHRQYILAFIHPS